MQAQPVKQTGIQEKTMAVLSMNFRGPRLGMTKTVNIITPKVEQAPGPWPVLYLLHGYSDNHTEWLYNTSLVRYAWERNMMIVMPDGLRTWYTNINEEDAMEQFITSDLVKYIDGTFNTIKSAAGRAIAGLSMGGYGAFMLSMKNPDMYCCASSHSGAFFYAHEIVKEMPQKVRTDTERLAPEYDVFKLAADMPKDKRFPLRFDCGESDWILKWNRQMHEHLDSIGWSHTYNEYPGEHNWAYWDSHICQTLDFAMENFAKSKLK